MIKMGEITCRIPSNGIKWEKLYCTEPEGYRLDVWAVGIDLAMAALTALLFIIAFLALGTAKGTLTRMQIDGDRQWKTIKKQISEQDRIAREAAKADRDLAAEQHQTELLVGHVTAIRNLQLAVRDPESDMTAALSDVSITRSTWAMYLHRGHHEMFELTKQYEDELWIASEFVNKQIKRVHAKQINSEDLMEHLLNPIGIWGDSVRGYIDDLTVWQVAPAARLERERNIGVAQAELTSYFRPKIRERNSYA